jgi:hypothetical protein
MARSNLPPSDLSKTLLPLMGFSLKLFAWTVFGTVLIGLLAFILDLFPLYHAIEFVISHFLWRLAAVILCFIGFVAMRLSMR